MILQDISFSTPAENILFDDVLLYLAEADNLEETLRLWESEQRFIVLGRTGKIKEDVNIEAVRRENIPVLRRSSGGGTVLQGKGCLNFSLILSKERHPLIRDLRRSYQYILEKVINAFGPLGQQLVFRPISDLATAAGEQKVSGNAQKRGKNFILHHGTILYHCDLGAMERFLKIPQDIPDYRRDRPHRTFVTNLPLDQNVIKKALGEAFSTSLIQSTPSAEQKVLLKQFVKNKEVVVSY